VKERVRAIVNTLPFKQYPNRLIVETVYNTIFWLNCFPHKDGIHLTLSPRTIITGSTIDYNKHCTLQFGTYAHVHEPQNNSLLPRTTGVNALQPSGNIQGRHFFLSLSSGKRIIRNKWTVLPITAEIIATIHQLAAACKKYKGIVFTDKDSNIINDDNDDTLEITGVDTTTRVHTKNEDTPNTDTGNNILEITGVSDNKLEIAGVSENTEENTEETETETETESCNTELSIAQNTRNEPDETGHNLDRYHEQYNDDISIEDGIPEDIHITINDRNTVHEMNAGPLRVDPNTREAIEEEADALTHGYNLPPRPTKRNQRYNMISIGQQSTIAKPHLHVMLNQVGIREGLKMFGEKVNDALLKKLNQLHERNALLPKKKEGMTYDKKSSKISNVPKRKKRRID